MQAFLAPNNASCEGMQVWIIADVHARPWPEVSLQNSGHVRVKKRLRLAVRDSHDRTRRILTNTFYLLQVETCRQCIVATLYHDLGNMLKDSHPKLP